MRIFNLFKVAALFLSTLVLTGCATNIKYTMDKGVYQKDQPYSYVAVVDVIEDKRPPEEHSGKIGIDSDYLYTKDKTFKPNIDMQVSKMLVDHLNKSRLLKAVELKNIDNDPLKNPNEIKSLAAGGADLAIVGNLKHFYGFQTGNTSATTASVLFGLAGALTEAIVNPKTVGGDVEYSDIKIIDLHKNSVLWEGDVDYDFKKKIVFYDTPAVYSLQALKEANNKFAQKIDEVLQQKEITLAKEESTPAETPTNSPLTENINNSVQDNMLNQITSNPEINSDTANSEVPQANSSVNDSRNNSTGGLTDVKFEQ